MRSFVISVALLFCMCLIVARPALAQQNIDSLIQSLADSDSQKREAAQKELTQRGAEARTALLAATRSNDPAVATEASRILSSLPWFRDDDSAQVKMILTEYGSLPIPGRLELIERINELPDGQGQPVLLRLILEEPSTDVCWQIVVIFNRERRPGFVDLARAMNPPADDRSPANMLVALAWAGKDYEKSLEYFRRAVEIEAQNPSFDDNKLSVAYTALADSAVGKGDYDQAARIRRLEAARAGLARTTSPRAVHHLFLLHARYGPLDGFSQDVQTFRQYLGHAEVLYSLSRIYARAGRTIESLAIQTAARSVNISTAAHLESANFFIRLGWTEPMRTELYATLIAPYSPISENPGPADELLQHLVARRLLASIATEESNDAAAIEHLSAVIALMIEIRQPIGFNGGVEQLSIGQLHAQVAWRKARIAKSQSDTSAVIRHLDEVMKAIPLDSDMMQNVYPLFKTVRRDEDAKTIFDAAYEDARQKLEESRDDATDLNDLAWLCARCDQKLPEALEWSTRAVAAEPDNAAFIDTLAEVYFRMGKADEAVKLEIRALQLRPEDVFMSGQLEKFRAASKNPQ